MLLQLISCFIVGRYFSELAFDNNKNRWGTVAIAVIANFVLQIILAIIIQIIFFGITASGFGSAIMASLISIALSGTIMFAIYKYLEKSWKTSSNTKSGSNLLDEDGYMKN